MPERVSVQTVYELLKDLKKLMLGNGQPGIIQRLQAQDEANKADIETRHRENQEAIGHLTKSLQALQAGEKLILWKIGAAAALAAGFFSGSGFVSLDHLIKLSLAFLQ